MTFVPRRFAGNLGTSGDSEIAVEGTFTLMGKPHEITVPLKVHMEGTQCRAAGSFTVPYVKLGAKGSECAAVASGEGCGDKSGADGDVDGGVGALGGFLLKMTADGSAAGMERRPYPRG